MKNFKRFLSLALALLMIFSYAPTIAYASEGGNNENIIVDNGTEGEGTGDGEDEIQPASEDEGGEPQLPNAEVKVLDPMVLTATEHNYICWPSGDATINRPLQIVMNFKAKDTVEEALAGGYSGYYTDFYLKVSGLAGGYITADDCYLAGNYGTWGWIVIPTDGLEIEDGVEYPVVSNYDAKLTYEEICGNVQNFTAAIYIAPEILEANPNMEVSLQLKLKNPETNELLEIGAPAVYDVEDLGVKTVAKIGDVKYATLQEAIDKAVDDDEIVLLENIDIADCELQRLDNSYDTYFLVEGKTVTINLNGKKISGKYIGDSMLVGVFSTDNNGHLTLTGNGTIDVTATGKVYSMFANYEEGCSITIENGTYKLDKASDSLIYTGGDEDVIVEGGTFTLGNVGTGSNGSPWIFNAGGQNTANIIVTGGTFNADIFHQFYIFEVKDTTEVAEKLGVPVKAAEDNGDGTWTVVDAVAYVDEQHNSGNWYTQNTGYATLEEAFAAAGKYANGDKGYTVTLVKSTNEKVELGKAITLNLNNFEFEGEIVLIDKDAKLTAPEGLNVTTSLEGYKAAYKDGVYSVCEQTYVEWVQEQLFIGNDVTLEQNIVITDYDLVHAHAWPANTNGKYDERHGYGAIFHIIKPGVELDLNGYSITWDAHDDDYCNKRQVSLFMVTITGNEGETSDFTVVDNSAAKTGKVDVYGMGTGMYVVGVDATGTIAGGTWTNYPCKTTCGASNIFIYPSHGGKLVITDGTFEQENSEYLLGMKGSTKETTNNGVGTDFDATEIVISGGTFVNFNPEEVKFFDYAGNEDAPETTDGCAENYEAIANDDGTYGVVPTKLAKVEVEIMPGVLGTSHITIENWEDLVAALGAKTNLPVKVTLLSDINLTNKVLTIAGAAEKVIDLNGYKLTGTVNNSTTAFVYVTGGCELTILDSSEEKTGGIHAVNTNGNLSNLIRVETDAKMVIESGNFTQDASVDGAGMIDSRGDEIITIKGGNFTLDNIGTESNGSPWIFNASSQNTKNIIVIGGTFNADIIHQYYPFEVIAPKEKALVKGEDGIWSFVDAVAYVNEQEWSSAWYTNEVGYATLQAAFDAVEDVRIKNSKTSAVEVVTLLKDNGETVKLGHKESPQAYNLDLKTFKFEGEIVLTNEYAKLTAPEGLNVTSGKDDFGVIYEEGVYKLSDAVAQIGTDGAKYESLQKAVEAAQTGDTVVLLKDIALTEADCVEGADRKVLVDVVGKDITLDMSGKKISVVHEDEFTNDYIVAVIRVADGAGLTVTGNGTIDVKVLAENPDIAYMFWKRGTTGHLTIENGTYHMNDSADSMVYTNGNEIVTVKGGTWTLDSVGTSTNGSPWIFNAQGTGGKQILITGGTFNADVNRQFWSDEAVVDKTCYTINNGNGTWTVKEGAVAYVNTGMTTGPYFAPKDIGYATIEEALEAADSAKDSPVTLLADVALNADVVITNPIELVSNGYTLDCGNYAIKLTAKDATLTAPEGLNVTSGKDGFGVIYEEEVYKLSDAVAQIGNNYYKTLKDAIVAANSGDTVVLLRDVEDSNDTSIVYFGTTLDLNGKYLTAKNFLAFGDVKDSTDGKGGIVISNDRKEAVVQLQPGNTQLPIYDTENGCYRFFNFALETKGSKSANDGNSAKFGFAFNFTNKEAYYLLAETTYTGFNLNLNISWTGLSSPVSYTIKAETISSYAKQTSQDLANNETSKKAITITINGVNNLSAGAEISVDSNVTSVTNATFKGNKEIYTVPAKD